MVTIKFFVFVLLAFISIPLFPQKMKTVEAEYTYYVPENVTLEEARHTALNRAKIQALADAFGTLVTQANSTVVNNRDGASSIDFLSLGDSEVKGEWIETIGDPVFDIFYEQGMLAVKASVKGRAREIVSAAIDFKAKVLRNGTDDKFESAEFKDGDDLYLSFLSPVSGYLAVYLADSSGQAYCLLPYRHQSSGIYSVVANRRYVLFSADEASVDERPYVDEYILTCSRQSLEYNVVYVVFSPQPFVKAADERMGEACPRQLTFDEFQKWLAKVRKHDSAMGLHKFIITIRHD